MVDRQATTTVRVRLPTAPMLLWDVCTWFLRNTDRAERRTLGVLLLLALDLLYLASQANLAAYSVLDFDGCSALFANIEDPALRRSSHHAGVTALQRWVRECEAMFGRLRRLFGLVEPGEGRVGNGGQPAPLEEDRDDHNQRTLRRRSPDGSAPALPVAVRSLARNPFRPGARGSSRAAPF
ncbi:hypothetical protein JCM10207_006798 [Rhodosporidiobolus poonsookiae]